METTIHKNIMKNLLYSTLISLLLINCQSNSERKAEILDYQIVKIQDSSFMNIPKMLYRIILRVDSLPTDKGMRNTASYLWEHGNKNWEKFVVFLYLPYMSTESTAYRVAEFCKDGLVRYDKNDDVVFGTKWQPKGKNESVETKSKSGILNFNIAKKEDISFMKIPRMVYRIILDVKSLPSVEEMKKTAFSIWGNGNKNWKEFTVFIYLPEMNTESPAFGVGEFNEGGLVRFDKNEFALIGTKWEIKKPVETVVEVPASKLKEYKIELSAINAGERKIRINISTNFPDGTNLSLYINRNFYKKGDSETYIEELFDKDFSIKNGKFELLVDIINERGWYNEVQREIKALPNDIKPISRISDKININVLYTAAATQPGNVLEILGTRGEFITGKGAKKFGTGTLGQLTSFSVCKEVNMPFN